jgi:hypothetical protein
MKKELLRLRELALGYEHGDANRGAVTSLGTHSGFVTGGTGGVDATPRKQGQSTAQQGSPGGHARLLERVELAGATVGFRMHARNDLMRSRDRRYATSQPCSEPPTGAVTFRFAWPERFSARVEHLQGMQLSERDGLMGGSAPGGGGWSRERLRASVG